MESIIILSNIGSASKKYSVYQDTLEIAWFHFEKTKEDFLCSYKIQSIFEKKHITSEQYRDSIQTLFELLEFAHVIKDKKQVQSIAVRAVVPHSDFVSDCLYTPEVLEKLKSTQQFDPIHINPLIEEIILIQNMFDSVIPIYLISDSSFHTTSQKKIPLDFDTPIYTTGYHGLSCESVISSLDTNTISHKKLIIVHLGGGSSVSAIKNGISVYNSMELSPLDGVIMSSRSGSIDPFATLLYMKQKNLTYEETLNHLYSQSGLSLLSGVSGDLRIIREEAFKGNTDAKYAIMQFVDSIVAHVCKATAYTQGIDTLVFTGTIGLRASYIREMVTEKLLWLGCVLDHTKNLESGDSCLLISSYDSRVKIFVVQIDEMKEMYTHVQKFLQIKK